MEDIAAGTQDGRSWPAPCSRRNSLRRLRHFVEIATDWLWESDMQHRICFHSGARKLGAEGHDPLGRPRWEQPGVFRDDAYWAAHIDLHEARQPFHNFVYRVMLPSSGLRWFETSGTPLFRRGRFVGYRGVARDVTERVRAQQTVEHREALLSAILDSAMVGIIAVDGNFRISLFNREAEAIFGWTEAEMLGQPLDRLLPSSVRPRHEALMRAFRDRPERRMAMGHWRRVSGVRRDGLSVPLTAALSKASAGSDTAMIIAFRDMTETLQVENRLVQLAAERERQALRAEAAAQAKTTLLHHISHEFRTPLNAVLGFSEMMALGVIGDVPESCRDAARMINESAETLRRMVDKIIDFVECESEDAAVRRFPVDPVEVVRGVVRGLASLAAMKGVKFVEIYPEPSRMVHVDPHAVARMTAELLDNAVKVSPEGGVVEVVVRLFPNGLEIGVCDRGPGMAPDALRRLYDAFHTEPSEIANPVRGIGLGLPLCRRLASLHGGDIRFANRRTGGLSATIWLPEPPQHGADDVAFKTERSDEDCSGVPDRVLQQNEGRRPMETDGWARSS